MAGTFKKLKRIKARLQGGADAAVAVPYELKCECGTIVTGMRRKSWIESECPECCQTLFVLAANTYPATKSVPSEVLGGTMTDRLKTVVQELFPKKSSTTKKKSKSRSKTDDAVEVEAVAKPRRKLSLPRIDILGFLKRTFSPFRLLMMAMTIVVGFTIYWMTYQNTVENARQTWLKSPEEIERLLEDREMIDLQQALESAVQAADVLQRNDPESRRVRNLLEETVGINTIASGDLLNGFHQAYDDDDLLVDDAMEQVESVCRSGTFVFDSYLQAKPGLSDVYLVDFPATPGRHPVEIIIPLPAVNEFHEMFPDGRAVFAGRIDRVVPPTAKTFEPWTLNVKASSFVLMTSLPHCEHVGLTAEDDETLTAVLKRQLEFVETSENWQDRMATVVIEQPDNEGESQ